MEEGGRAQLIWKSGGGRLPGKSIFVARVKSARNTKVSYRNY
jgi:hypothetical protein